VSVVVTAAVAATLAAGGAGYGWLVNRTFRYSALSVWAFAIFSAGWAAFWVAFGSWPAAAWAAGVTAYALCWLWRRRKRRGRLAAIGAKTRARIAAMTARTRERPARPALRPVPQGGAR
jgi:hypothetical protein